MTSLELISRSMSNDSQTDLRICLRIRGFSRTYNHQLQQHCKYSIMIKMCLCTCTCLMYSYLKWKRFTNTMSIKDNYPWLGYNTSSISLVFDFSNESTLEWRLLTVLLKLIKKKFIQITQTHKGKKRYFILTSINCPEFFFLKFNPFCPCFLSVLKSFYFNSD